ncbi:MAG: hypothetical protein LBJ18_03735 [Rickettsiales bacterium]|jgi:hypothetical protein|nr:hypothetical protein [Rickettsiales bacterium]
MTHKQIATDFPLFHLIVEAGKYTLVNNTGNKHDEENMQRQTKWFADFSISNQKEYGKAVKQVVVVVHSNNFNNNNFIPVQDTKDSKKNTKRSYKITYEDDTDSGWLLWLCDNSASTSVWHADNLLGILAEFPEYRRSSWAARELCVAAANNCEDDDDFGTPLTYMPTDTLISVIDLINKALPKAMQYEYIDLIKSYCHGLWTKIFISKIPEQ